MHTPVLLNEVLEYLDPKPGDFIIDGTLDGGGHAEKILARIGSRGKFLGVDWDEGMIEKFHFRMGKKENLFLTAENYKNILRILRDKKLGKADGLLLDLGFSSEQLSGSGRGFSFNSDTAEEPLLMTYEQDRMPVRELIKKLREEELSKIIFEFSGERYARRIAKAVKLQEKKEGINTSGELAEVVRSAVPRGYERGRIDPATRTFQAFRIYANDELGNLEEVLKNLTHILKTGGRAVIISFHSLEDRVVKKHFSDYKKDGMARILTKKPIGPTFDELQSNPRSRSAKLRAIELINIT